MKRELICIFATIIFGLAIGAAFAKAFCMSQDRRDRMGEVGHR